MLNKLNKFEQNISTEEFTELEIFIDSVTILHIFLLTFVLLVQLKLHFDPYDIGWFLFIKIPR